MSPSGASHPNERTSLEVALNAELEPALLEQIRRAVPDARISTKRELAQDPARLERAEVLLTQHVDPQRVARLENLRWVQTYGAGVDWLLTREILAREDLAISNARGIHAQPIAEHVFGLMLTLARRLDGAILQQQKGEWNTGALTGSLRTLEGATLGIVGLGAIGQRIAELGRAFHMRVIGTRRGGQPTRSVDETFGPDGLLKVLAQSQYVVNALPLTPQTRHVFNHAAFAELRPDAVFINIGRGASVDTQALVAALRAGKLGGALLDVTEPEPLPPEHALWHLPNVLITPHYAGAHPAYAQHVTDIFVDNLARYVNHQPLRNLVDKRAGY